MKYSFITKEIEDFKLCIHFAMNQASLTSAQVDFESLAALDAEINHGGSGRHLAQLTEDHHGTRC
jgi:hypothetical protein